MTSVGYLRKRLAVVALASLAGGALGALVPTPAAASYYEHGVSFSARIVRDSVPYRLRVRAIEAMGFTYRLQVSVSKLRDPAGPIALRQTQTWTFDLEEGDFQQDGDTYRIDAGGKDAAFDVEVIVERRQDARCGERQALFVTEPEGGAFRIETGNETFGTISELPACGRPWSYASGETPGPPPCPLEGQELQSEAISVKEGRSGDVARIHVFDTRLRDVDGHPVRWYLNVKGTLPAVRFRLKRDLEGHLRAGGTPWLTGRARFNPQQPLERGDWYDCKGGREARSVKRSGGITGNLTLDVIGYDSYRIKVSDALALRSRVRPRT